ncbi:Alpha-crystallin domain-containing protein 22.3 [Camellia lanceoleosa]|uniref:Alpha-crystallin domain-containing protein 22.3 n=1 Tax=Camellia lanceoleosa TaxID=1840588 RepID=A0ACC0IJ98_9ERIC|nr:Alpha-crystallin domain-containing protein 22.3 [Camellia lanceoleosa]
MYYIFIQSYDHHVLLLLLLLLLHSNTVCYKMNFSAASQCGTKRSYDDEFNPTNDLSPTLDVAPLNAVPFSGSPPRLLVTTEREAEVENPPKSPTMKAEPQAEHPPQSLTIGTKAQGEQIKPPIIVLPSQQIGNAANDNTGPIIGLVDIGESEDSYLFRVSLPGVLTNHGKFTYKTKLFTNAFSCSVKSTGEIKIEGVTTTGETKVEKHHHTFEMLTKNLCPPGQFSVSFQLPGPVDEYQFSGLFGIDGVCEGIVKKKI